jgi:hypothetical protein
MNNKWINHKWIILLLGLLLFCGCYSNRNKTEERAKERVTQFILFMATNQFDAAEKLLSSEMVDSENKELFLSNFDDWQLKDTASLKIDIQEVFIPKKEKKNRALVSMTISNVNNNFSKIVSMPIRYEKGDWFLGA